MNRLERLEGGFINEVYRRGDIVEKRFMGDELVGKKGARRLQREAGALKRFGGWLSPKLMGLDGRNVLYEEFIDGELIKEGSPIPGAEVFEQAGRVLRSIHQPVKRNSEYLRHDFVRKLERNYEIVKPILDSEDVRVNVNVDWEEVEKLATTRVHRDFWLGNVILTDTGLKVVDWEFSGVGSPYEDFAIVELWIIREYQESFPGVSACFWKGYGDRPDQTTTQEFLKARCIEFLSTVSLTDYAQEPVGGFYHNKIDVLRTLE